MQAIDTSTTPESKSGLADTTFSIFSRASCTREVQESHIMPSTFMSTRTDSESSDDDADTREVLLMFLFIIVRVVHIALVFDCGRLGRA